MKIQDIAHFGITVIAIGFLFIGVCHPITPLGEDGPNRSSQRRADRDNSGADRDNSGADRDNSGTGGLDLDDGPGQPGWVDPELNICIPPWPDLWEEAGPLRQDRRDIERGEYTPKVIISPVRIDTPADCEEAPHLNLAPLSTLGHGPIGCENLGSLPR